MATSQLRRLEILLLFLIGFSLKSFTQSAVFGVPQVISYTKDEYNAGTQNWAIVQDASGMMIFGNNKGVLFFDGTHWDLLPMPNRTVVRSVAKGVDGRVFVGGQDEFGWLTKNGHSPVEYHSLVDKLEPEDRSFEDVWKIFPTEERVFFCTQKALFVYENDAFLVVKSAQRFQNFFFVNEQLYAQERGRGLVRWEDGQFVLLPGGEQFDELRIASILPRGADLLIISDFSGLFLLSENKISPWPTEVSSFLQKNQAYCALLLPTKDIAIGTAQDGLVVIDQEGKMLLHLNKDTGLQNNTILAIARDRLNNYWLALDNGIDYVEISMPFARIADEIGLQGTGYAAELFEGKLYLGTNQGLFSIDWPLPHKSNLRNQLSKVVGLKGQIWELNRLGTALLINSHAGTFQLQNGVLSPISPPQGAWKIMLLKGASSLAIEGGYTGLYLYENTSDDPDLPRWRYQHRIEGFDESARVIEQDQEGNIWVSHAYKGLFKIQLREDYRKAEVRYFGEADGLPGTIAINVLKIDGEVLFTTPEGIYTYDQTSDRFTPYEAFNKILGGKKEIYRLVQDEEEKLWFSMGNEFGYLNIQEKGFLEKPGIEQLFFNHLQDELVDGFEEVYALDKENTIIATENGFVSYSPQRGAQRDLQLNVLLREVRTITGADSLLYGDGLLLSSSTAETKVHELASRLNALHFIYAAPFYEQIGQLNYRYWLKGYEEGWSDWSTRTDKEYTNLESGDYEFQVQARNTYGIISDPVSYQFTILPPWYASSLAKAIYLLLGLLALGGIFVFFSRKMERERQAFTANQARTLAEKEAEFQQEKEKSEEEIDRLRSQNLESDIQHRTSRLASATMHLVQKGEVLLKIKKELVKVHKQVSAEENRKKLQKIIHTIDGNIRLDSNWEQFEAYFDQVHENFLRNLRETYPDLTPKDQKLCAYLRMNLTTKEIAPLMNISVRGVEISRYRLRKKLDLDTNTNLTDFIMRF